MMIMSATGLNPTRRRGAAKATDEAWRMTPAGLIRVRCARLSEIGPVQSRNFMNSVVSDKNYSLGA
jgi:hypothetical protein